MRETPVRSSSSPARVPSAVKFLFPICGYILSAFHMRALSEKRGGMPMGIRSVQERQPVPLSGSHRPDSTLDALWDLF